MVDQKIHELVSEVYHQGLIDPKAGAINLQIQVQVQFLADEMLENELIDEETHQKISQKIKKLYPTTARPKVRKT